MEVLGLSLEHLVNVIKTVAPNPTATATGPEYKYAKTNKVFNTLQHYKKILILDFRAPDAFSKAHFVFSVNVPHSILTAGEFLNYDPIKFMAKYFQTPRDKELFMYRKRLVVFLIPSNGSVKHLCDGSSSLKSELSLDPSTNRNNFLRAKGFALSCLAYKALSKEKVRELYIVQDGCKDLLDQFPFLCEFCDNKIYIEPYIFIVVTS